MAIAQELERGLQHAIEAMPDLAAVKEISNSPDIIEGARAFAERRTPNWTNPTRT
jgi:hypothetical protein